jgi:dihydropteroate synthase
MSQVKIMGILNATPDSFFEGSRLIDQKAVDVAGKMLEEGADILDIGGQSTRPGAIPVSASEEADRVLPVLENIAASFSNVAISVDTFYCSVAKQAVIAGANMVNDISAGDDDPEMLPFIAQNNISYIAMHKKGNPQTMQKNPEYKNVTETVIEYFRLKEELFQSLGINQWIIDPGFGFGKTIEHNFQLLREMQAFRTFGKPVLVGISRKSMIWKTLQSTAANALNGTTALHMSALMNGADILRVHDVKEAKECVSLYQAVYG